MAAQASPEPASRDRFDLKAIGDRIAAGRWVGLTQRTLPERLRRG